MIWSETRLGSARLVELISGRANLEMKCEFAPGDVNYADCFFPCRIESRTPSLLWSVVVDRLMGTLHGIVPRAFGW